MSRDGPVTETTIMIVLQVNNPVSCGPFVANINVSNKKE